MNRLHPTLVATSFAMSGAALAAGTDPSTGTFVLRVLEKEVGRETFEVQPDGWKTKGSYDVFGQQKAEFEISEKRAGDVLTVSAKGKVQGHDTSLVATIAPDRFESRVESNAPSTLDLQGKPTPLPYQDLIWAYWLDIGRALANRVTAGTLKPGDLVDLVELTGAKTLSLKVREFSVAERVHDGSPASILTFEIALAGTVDGTLVTTKQGTPLYFAIPAQKVDVALEGYDDLKPPPSTGRTIVDSGAWRSTLSKPEYGVTVDKKVFARMRDGVKLAADVYRPDREGKFPTILVRTCYGRELSALQYGSFFARRGYAVVSQDVRGRNDSEGTFDPLRQEEADGSDTLDWVAAQPWSNGDVGMIGASYLGHAQWMAAKSGNPHLKAIIPEVAPPDPQFNVPYNGGILVTGSVWWARAVEDISRIGHEQVDWVQKLATLPISDLDTAFGLKLGLLRTWISHPPHDRWWDAQSYQRDFSKLDVPALNVSGWYDGDQPGAPSNFVGMRKGAKSERSRKGQWLLMGPWTHFFNTASRIGDLDFGSQALIDLDSVCLRWFDHYLKQIDNGVEREDPVLVFTMRENAWHREKDWPLPQTRWTKLHLAGNGKANARNGGGTLALAADAASPPDRYAYDPAVLPETKVDFDDLTHARAVRDLAKDPERADMLYFTSPPLAAPVEITGPITATLSVSTDAKDTDFVVTLARVSPSGVVTGIRSGYRRLRYRSGYDREDFAKPGETSTLDLDLWATGIRLEAGERLRVHVSSTAFPGIMRNLNTGEPDATATKIVVAHQTIFHDAKHPSFVTLPVIPREGLGELRFAASEAAR
jgi:uncharacterized protein